MITRVNRRLSDPSNTVQTLAPITVTDTRLASDETAVKEPEDPEVKRAADKLAAFVAARGRAAEEGARAKNPGGDTPFRFLHDKTCNDYRYYESKIAEAEGGEKSGAGASTAPAPAQPAAPAAMTPPGIGIPPPPPPDDSQPRRRSRWGLAPGERATEAPAQRPTSGWDASPAPQRRAPSSDSERTAAAAAGRAGRRIFERSADVVESQDLRRTDPNRGATSAGSITTRARRDPRGSPPRPGPGSIRPPPGRPPTNLPTRLAPNPRAASSVSTRTPPLGTRCARWSFSRSARRGRRSGARTSAPSASGWSASGRSVRDSATPFPAPPHRGRRRLRRRRGEWASTGRSVTRRSTPSTTRWAGGGITWISSCPNTSACG